MKYADATKQMRKHLAFILDVYPHKWQLTEHAPSLTWELKIELGEPGTSVHIHIQGRESGNSIVTLKVLSALERTNHKQTFNLGAFLVIVAAIMETIEVGIVKVTH